MPYHREQAYYCFPPYRRIVLISSHIQSQLQIYAFQTTSPRLKQLYYCHQERLSSYCGDMTQCMQSTWGSLFLKLWSYCSLPVMNGQQDLVFWQRPIHYLFIKTIFHFYLTSTRTFAVQACSGRWCTMVHHLQPSPGFSKVFSVRPWSFNPDLCFTELWYNVIRAVCSKCLKRH